MNGKSGKLWSMKFLRLATTFSNFSMVKFTSPGEQGGESTRPKMDAL